MPWVKLVEAHTKYAPFYSLIGNFHPFKHFLVNVLVFVLFFPVFLGFLSLGLWEKLRFPSVQVLLFLGLLFLWFLLLFGLRLVALDLFLYVVGKLLAVPYLSCYDRDVLLWFVRYNHLNHAPAVVLEPGYYV